MQLKNQNRLSNAAASQNHAPPSICKGVVVYWMHLWTIDHKVKGSIMALTSFGKTLIYTGLATLHPGDLHWYQVGIHSLDAIVVCLIRVHVTTQVTLG